MLELITLASFLLLAATLSTYLHICTFPGPRPQATAATAAASFLLTKKRRLLKECVSASKRH